MANWNQLRLSAMHSQHLEMGAAMVESHGWQRPARYTSADRELEQLRGSVGLFDISPSGKLAVQGSDVDHLLGTLFADTGPIETGKVRVQRHGELSSLQTAVLARLAEDEVMILTEPGEESSVLDEIEAKAAPCAHVMDITSALAGLRITGPSAHSLLAAVTELDVEPHSFPNMSCAQGSVAEIHGMILRLDLGGLLSYDLYVGRDYGEYVWSALVEAGEEFDLTAYGTEAMERF